jgi:L-histidine Nalpha-methyltransferase / hercynylcysteine S-oxide synthase
VDNPEKCHDHSEIPDSWPALDELQKYQLDVRARFIESIESGRLLSDRRLARGYWLAYEHEAMHLETFLYMLIQSSRILPPPGATLPNFEQLAIQAGKLRDENQWHRIPHSDIVLGLDDPENDDGPDRFFGWDIERPPRKVQVATFEAQSRPISNGDYAKFLEETYAKHVPASWIVKKSLTNGVTTNDIATKGTASIEPSAHFVEDKSVRTVYGSVPLKFALDWPVMASYDELAAYARWAGGRIPTVEEARSIYNYVETNKLAPPEKPGELISAVNG